MKKFLIVLVGLTFLVVTLGGNAFAQDELVFAEGDWPGIWAKNAVATTVLNKIGYNVEKKMISEPLIYKGLSDGQIDAFLGSWMPATRKKREAVKNSVDFVTTNMDGCIYTMGVPSYVYEAGVKTFNDLNKYAEKFNKKMYVGPTGWDSALNMSEAIKNDIYNLGDWETVNSSQSALIAHVKNAVENKEWVVFVAWKPHWMNYILDIKYLDEPEGKIWKNPVSHVDTLAKVGLKEENPDVYKFLEQFKASTEAGDKWIYEIGQKEKKSKEVAEEWIANNLDKVKEWLDGVKAADGRDGIAVLKENI